MPLGKRAGVVIHSGSGRSYRQARSYRQPAYTFRSGSSRSYRQPTRSYRQPVQRRAYHPVRRQRHPVSRLSPQPNLVIVGDPDCAPRRTVVTRCEPEPRVVVEREVVVVEREVDAERARVDERELQPEPQPLVVVAKPTRPALPSVPRVVRQRSLSERVLASLEAGDLLGACQLATWAGDDPRRERALQAAIFRSWPSPKLLSEARAKLEHDSSLRDHPGRATLVRMLGPSEVPSETR